MFMPDVCQWVDVVKFDVDKKVRTEIGRNITKADDGVKVYEDSKWWYDEEKKCTVFHRKLELAVPGIPEYFISKCVGFYSDNVMRVRKEEADAIRKLYGSIASANELHQAVSTITATTTLVSSSGSNNIHKDKMANIANFFVLLVLIVIIGGLAIGLFDMMLSHFQSVKTYA
jgi:hypothetical protein